MGKMLLSKLVAIVAAMFVLLSANVAAAHKHEILVGAQCHASSDLDQSIEQMAGIDEWWTCSEGGWKADEPVAWLKFSRADWEETGEPTIFLTRIGRFESITLTAVNVNGIIGSETFTSDQAKAEPAGAVFSLPIPQFDQQVDTLIVRIEGPHNIPMLTEALVSPSVDDITWTYFELAVIAAIFGMLITPLVFDLSFFMILRERFVLLHAAMVICMIGYVLFSGNLITAFVDIPIDYIAVGGPLFWAIGVGVSAFFMVEFLERDALPDKVRTGIRIAGLWTILLPGAFSLQLSETQAFDDFGYFISFMPMIFIYSGALLLALYRGSRSARFLAVAWIPLILAASERLLRGLGVYAGPASLDQMLFVGMGLEVVIVSMGVAHRFLSVRRERDSALTEARMHEKLSERDPLTGLLNRRAIDAQFEDLHAAGYDTFALIDLDHFKKVNDTAGHAIGDTVLEVTANVLKSGDNTLAVRMGGEEFILLIKGEDSIDRAEAIRQAIPVRVAQQVPGLERIVTASMGVVVIEPGTLPAAAFSDIYSLADRLLYEAKEQGRNRSVSETWRGFHQRKEDRRSNAA